MDAPGPCTSDTAPSIVNGNEISMNDSDTDSLSWYMANVSEYYKFNLKLAYLNINSITNKIDEVKEMLGKGMFDILFIAESKIDSTTSTTLLAQPGFRLVRRDRKKGGGGLLVYIRVDLSVYRGAKLEPRDVESICLDVKDINNSRFLVCGCYRWPGKCNELEFTLLINVLIANRSWPDEWKCGNLTPVFKKEEDTRKENYRPVSVLKGVVKGL